MSKDDTTTGDTYLAIRNKYVNFTNLNMTSSKRRSTTIDMEWIGFELQRTIRFTLNNCAKSIVVTEVYTKSIRNTNNHLTNRVVTHTNLSNRSKSLQVSMWECHISTLSINYRGSRISGIGSFRDESGNGSDGMKLAGVVIDSGVEEKL